MKKIYIPAIAIFIFASGCKKCLTCSTGTYGAPTEKICEGDVYYQAAKNGTHTNSSGQTLNCY